MLVPEIGTILDHIFKEWRPFSVGDIAIFFERNYNVFQFAVVHCVEQVQLELPVLAVVVIKTKLFINHVKCKIKRRVLQIKRLSLLKIRLHVNSNILVSAM